MLPYAGTNFLVALNLDTQFSIGAETCLASASAEQSIVCPVTDLLQVELTNAMQMHVFQSRHGGPLRISWEAAGAAMGKFEDHLSAQHMLKTASLQSDELRREAMKISMRHTAKSGFRTYDILHVASALLLGCDYFWSFDRKARELAEKEGLAVNPWPEQ